MDANTYQAEAKRTLIDAPDREIPENELHLVWAALTLAIEAGKLVEHLKKAVFHQHGIDANLWFEKLQAIIDIALNQSAGQNTISAPALSDEDIMKLWNLAGLIGEAAEIGETVKADLEQWPGHQEHAPKELKKELGDVSWYIAALATKYGLSLNDILIGNVEKLQKRYRNGYSSEASRNRQE